MPITKEPDVSQLAIAVFKINDFDKIAMKQRNLFPSCFFHTLFKQYRYFSRISRESKPLAGNKQFRTNKIWQIGLQKGNCNVNNLQPFALSIFIYFDIWPAVFHFITRSCLKDWLV